MSEKPVTRVIAEPCIGTQSASRIDVCPADAIFFQRGCLPEWKDHIAKDREWFRERQTSGAFRPRSERQRRPRALQLASRDIIL